MLRTECLEILGGEAGFAVCCIRGDAMKHWKAQTVRLDHLEAHLNQLARDGYEVFGLYPVMLAIGADDEITTFLVVAKKGLDYMGKEMAQLETEVMEQ